VLFPSAGAADVRNIATASPEPLALIVLDGTWPQAVRLQRGFATLGISFVRAPAGTRSEYRLRAQAHEGDLSTLEAVARALGAVEGARVEAHLLRLHRLFVDQILWQRGLLASATSRRSLAPQLDRERTANG
jgi:DTW domain-containing protein YfiP